MHDDGGGGARADVFFVSYGQPRGSTAAAVTIISILARCAEAARYGVFLSGTPLDCA